MAGPQNGIMGSPQMPNFGTDLPQTQTPEDAMAEIAKAAKFSKTREFQELKEYLESRIKFFQSNLPGGTPLAVVDPKIIGATWLASDTIVRELQAIIGVYEGAALQLKEAKRSESTG